MRVRWNKQSKEQLLRTAGYIRYEFGQDTMDEFIKDVKRTNKLLSKNPNLGQVEPLLAYLPIEYHSIVFSSINKIVYRIVDKHIEVVALWDTRREPQKLVDTIKQPNK